MALSAAEQENIDALRRWWDEYGKTLLLTAAVAAAGYAGWVFWQNSTQSGSLAASDLYEEILDAAQLATPPGDGAAAAEGDNIIALAEQLKAEHGDTVYARYAALFSARQSMLRDDLAAAEENLRWVLDNPSGGVFGADDEGLTLIATLRLGRVILARSEPERALTLVNSIDPRSFEPGFHELRGDIYLSLDRPEDARDSWLAARDAGSNSDGLRMKLENLGAAIVPP